MRKNALVRVHLKSHPGKSLLTYVVIHDQSNRSLVKSELLEYFMRNNSVYVKPLDRQRAEI